MEEQKEQLEFTLEDILREFGSGDPIPVEEPAEDAALNILKALKPGLERHHHLRITEDAMKEAVRLSVRYLPEQFLPDKEEHRAL